MENSSFVLFIPRDQVVVNEQMKIKRVEPEIGNAVVLEEGLWEEKGFWVKFTDALCQSTPQACTQNSVLQYVLYSEIENGIINPASAKIFDLDSFILQSQLVKESASYLIDQTKNDLIAIPLLESSPLYLKGIEPSDLVCGQIMDLSLRIELLSNIEAKETLVLKFPVNFVFAEDTAAIALKWRDEDNPNDQIIECLIDTSVDSVYDLGVYLSRIEFSVPVIL